MEKKYGHKSLDHSVDKHENFNPLQEIKLPNHANNVWRFYTKNSYFLKILLLN